MYVVYLETSFISYLTARPSRTIIGAAHLEINEQVEQIALCLVQRGLVPPQVAEDALHIAIAAAHKVDFILTWNFKHIANPIMQRRIATFLDEINLPLPFICTPEELLGEDDGTISH